MGDFPNNSQQAKRNKSEASQEVDLQIEKIINGEATVSKPSGFKRLRRSFIAGDASSVSEHVFWNLMIPAMKDALSDMGSTFIDMMIYGERRARTTPGAPASGPGSTSKVNYGNYSSGNRPVIAPGQQVQENGRFDLNDITVGTRAEAEAIIGKMFEILDKYHIVTVDNLHSMLGVSSTYVDSKWGWTNLDGADVRRVKHGVRLVLPPPTDLGA